MQSGDAAGADGEDSPISFPEANIAAVRGVTRLLETTLGPAPRDKLVVGSDDGDPAVPDVEDHVVTSDGAAILDALPLEHPIAPIVRDIAGPRRPGDTDVVGKDIPDGVTTTLVLADALLSEARSLLDRGLSPRDVTRGFDLAGDIANDALHDAVRDPADWPGGDGLRACARTAITGNDVGGKADTWARFAVESVRTVGAPDERSFVVRQTNDGSIDDSRLVEGAVLDANAVADYRMPETVTDADVLVIGGFDRGGLRDPEVDGRYVATPESAEDAQAFRDVFSENRAEVVECIRDVGVDVVVTRLGISPEYQALLADAGIVGVRGVSRLDIRQVASATGASLLTNPEDVSRDHLGYAGRVTEVTVGSRRDTTGTSEITVFEDCRDPDSVALLLHGVTEWWAEQATTQVRKAANAAAIAAGETALPSGVVPGGGATHLRVARRAEEAALSEGSRAQLSVQAFADALTRVVAVLAANCGREPIDVVSSLRRAHDEGRQTTGVVSPLGETGDTWTEGVLDPAGLRFQQYQNAVEVANLILRIDDTVDATFSQEPDGPSDVTNPDAAKRHQQYVEENDTRWD